MAGPKQVVSRREIYRGRRLLLVEETLRVASGAEVVRERIEHPGAVVLLPILDDGRIVLIRQWRQAMGAEFLELPAGTLERGEPPESCAHRELIEETGYRARTLTALGTLAPAPGFCNERQYVFVARGLEPAFAAPDEDEEITTEPLSASELRQAVADGTIEDGKTLATCLRAILSGDLMWS